MIQDRNISGSVAFLIDRKIVYYATQPVSEIGKTPFTAITKLIQGIYQLNPEQARRILRQRIYSNLSRPTAMSYGMVKVAAKRLTCGVALDQVSLLREAHEEVDLTECYSPVNDPNLVPKDLGSLAPSVDQDFMGIAHQLAAAVPRSKNLYLSDRAVGCLLVATDPNTGEDKILATGVNTNARNRTLHAEVNMLQSYYHRTGKLIPAHSRVYVSLQCCRMCASMLWDCATDRSQFQVFYGQSDPGPHAKDTILSAHTQDRKRFSGLDLVSLQVEFPCQ